MTDLKWWQTAVFFQIYPRSFADSNDDGIGDIPGIIEKLDYLSDLGIDAIWLSPHYPSPQFDCGYDIADYTDVEPDYGTLDDFRSFLTAAHQRDIRVILDLVLNHTSDQHSWFQESRASKDSPKRDWYIWRDGRDGGPPNNWSAAFDDVAWTYDETTDQWYYHFFFAEQPDLNWRNPEVKQAMWDAVRFWLDMGVDGFRLDAIGTIYEDPDLPDHQAKLSMVELRQRSMASYPDKPDPETSAYLADQRELMNKYQVFQPGLHELLQELRTLIDEYDERVLVGEIDDIDYYGDGSNELHMVFNFPLMDTDRLTPTWIRKNQEERLASLPEGAWPCNTLGNHDAPRLYSRYADGEHDDQLARLNIALMLTLKGTPYLYNGEEIGMIDLMLDDIEMFRDNLGVWLYREITQSQIASELQALEIVQKITRDKCRTPMQWANAANAGFSPETVKTWLPVNPNFATGINVEEQLSDPASILNFYKELLSIRKNNRALVEGDYQSFHEDQETFFSFLRTSPLQRCLVILNYTNQVQSASFDLDSANAKLIFSNAERSNRIDPKILDIRPFEVLIVELSD